MTLTIYCALCAHSREQHTVVFPPRKDEYPKFYCKGFCPCNGATTFQGKGTLQPSKRRTQ